MILCRVPYTNISMKSNDVQNAQGEDVFRCKRFRIKEDELFLQPIIYNGTPLSQMVHPASQICSELLQLLL